MKGHARDHDIRLEEQRALDEQRVLVVQEVLPQPVRYELG